MKHIRIEGSTIKPAQPLGDGSENGAETGIDLIVSDDAVVRTIDLGGEVEGLSSEYDFTSFGPPPVALTKDQRDELDRVFKQIAEALYDDESMLLRRRGFPLAPGDEWLDRAILRAQTGFSRAVFKTRIDMVNTAARNIEKVVFEIADLLSLIRVEDGIDPGSSMPLVTKGSRTSATGMTAVDAIAEYADELRDLTDAIEAAYPAHRQKKVWRLTLTRAIADAWHRSGGSPDEEIFRRVAVAAASAIERKPAGEVDDRWIEEALAWGEGAPWQAR